MNWAFGLSAVPPLALKLSWWGLRLFFGVEKLRYNPPVIRALHLYHGRFFIML